jgi:hypothetical protein
MAVNRITTSVDERILSTLRGNVHPLARPEFDQGRVDDSLPMEHIVLMLQRSPEQETALNSRIDQMHNRQSPYYHQWLRPEEVGACYGPVESDIAAVTRWLQIHGFKIDTVPAGRTMIIFSGTAGQVRNTFHTEIHNLYVNGEWHIANMSEPQIPKALAPVIMGFRSLHNFFPKPNIRMIGDVRRDGKTGIWQWLNRNIRASNFTYSYNATTFYAVGPQDFYTIYNENPLLPPNSNPITGDGQTLAVVEITDITQSDVATFRSAFGLPTYPSTPNATIGGINWMQGISGFCTDPGMADANDEGEASLDIEMVGTTAPNAIIDYVACQSTNTTFGWDLAFTYIINNLASSVSAISSSYGVCETDAGSAGDAMYTAMYEQAVAEGQTVVIATGDSGSDACDRHNGKGPNQGQDLGETGLSVQSASATAYVVAAGGTDFSDVYQGNTNSYWNPTNGAGLGSALSYIPEKAWNDTCSDTVLVDYIQRLIGGGFQYPNGPEGLCNDTTHFAIQYPFTTLGGGTGGVSAFIPLPTWQSVYGIGSGNFTSTSFRNLPDISLFASDGFWNQSLVICDSNGGQNPCDYTNGGDVTMQGVGGTSAVAPLFTGIIGLINEKYGRQGQANYTLYALAQAEYGTTGTPNTSTTSPSIYTCEGSNANAIGAYSGVFPKCIFYEVDRTSQIGASTCVGANNSGCLFSNNGGACASGTPGCFTNTQGDPYGVLSASTTSFESAFSNSAGYNDATGLGSVNVANLVNNWTKVPTRFPSTTAVKSSSTSIFTTTTTNLTATVTATGRGSLAPALGTVSFYSGSACTGTVLGTANLVPASGCTTSCNSSATLSNVAGSAIGTNTTSIDACFGGDAANDAPSTGTTNITVTQTAFTLAAESSAVTITAGQQGTVQLNLSANADVAGSAVTMACSGLPSGASCKFSPITSPITTSATVVTMTITTSTADAKMMLLKTHGSSSTMFAFILPGIVLLPISASGMRRRRECLLRGLALLVMTALMGCGGGSGGSGSSTATPASQNYSVTVTASAPNVNSGTTSTITVTVTQ